MGLPWGLARSRLCAPCELGAGVGVSPQRDPPTDTGRRPSEAWFKVKWPVLLSFCAQCIA